MKKYKFNAKIEAGDGGGAYVLFPYDTGKAFATKGNVPVKATFNGVPYTGSPNIMSNTATSTVLIPLGMSILPGNLKEVCMIIGLAASTALFLPVSTPPNAIAYDTGLIEQKDFRIGGLLIRLLGPAIIVVWVLLIT